MIHIGFTGTQNGMTRRQKEAVAVAIMKLPVSFFAHHGDCIGADEEFHRLIREFRPNAVIKIHPPIEEKKRAFCKGDLYAEPKEYRKRNYDIVDESMLLIGASRKAQEINYSGTWMTIRYARKTQTTHVVFGPDGEMIEWNNHMERR